MELCLTSSLIDSKYGQQRIESNSPCKVHFLCFLIYLSVLLVVKPPKTFDTYQLG